MPSPPPACSLPGRQPAWAVRLLLHLLLGHSLPCFVCLLAQSISLEGAWVAVSPGVDDVVVGTKGQEGGLVLGGAVLGFPLHPGSPIRCHHLHLVGGEVASR